MEGLSHLWTVALLDVHYERINEDERTTPWSIGHRYESKVYDTYDAGSAIRDVTEQLKKSTISRAIDLEITGRLWIGFYRSDGLDFESVTPFAALRELREVYPAHIIEMCFCPRVVLHESTVVKIEPTSE